MSDAQSPPRKPTSRRPASPAGGTAPEAAATAPPAAARRFPGRGADGPARERSGGHHHPNSRASRWAAANTPSRLVSDLMGRLHHAEDGLREAGTRLAHARTVSDEHTAAVRDALGRSQAALAALRGQVADAAHDRDARAALRRALTRAEKVASGAAETVAAITHADRTLSRLAALPADTRVAAEDAAAGLRRSVDDLIAAVGSGVDPGHVRAALAAVRSRIAAVEAVRARAA